MDASKLSDVPGTTEEVSVMSGVVPWMFGVTDLEGGVLGVAPSTGQEPPHIPRNVDLESGQSRWRG